MNYLKKLLSCVALITLCGQSLHASMEDLEDHLERAIELSDEKEVKTLLKEKRTLEPDDKKEYYKLASSIVVERKKSLRTRRDMAHLVVGTVLTAMGATYAYDTALETYNAFNPVVEEKSKSLAPVFGGALLGGLDFFLGTRGLLFNGGKYLWSFTQPDESPSKETIRQENLRKAGLVTAFIGSVVVTTGSLYYATRGLLCSSGKEWFTKAAKIKRRLKSAPEYTYSIGIKNIDATVSLDDGYRLLVDAALPEELSREKVFGIGWFKELLPSKPLAEWFLSNKANYEGFSSRYRAELSKHQDKLAFLKKISLKNKVTLLYRTNFNVAKVLEEAILAS